MIETAGVAIVDLVDMDVNTDPTVLCVRAYSNWDFPKGCLDPDETHISAAVREVEEETCLTHGNDYILIGQPCAPVVYKPAADQKRATYYIGVRTSDKTPFLPYSEEIGKPENDEFRWVPLSQLSDLCPARLSGVVEEIRQWTEGQQHGRTD